MPTVVVSSPPQPHKSHQPHELYWSRALPVVRLQHRYLDRLPFPLKALGVSPASYAALIEQVNGWRGHYDAAWARTAPRRQTTIFFWFVLLAGGAVAANRRRFFSRAGCFFALPIAALSVWMIDYHHTQQRQEAWERWVHHTLNPQCGAQWRFGFDSKNLVIRLTE